MHPYSKVYLATDDMECARRIHTLLDSIRLPVECVSDPDMFLDRYRPSSPECLISDTRLPGGSGLEFQRRLRKRNPILPIIFLTTHADVATAVRAMKQGAHDYLLMPLHAASLLESVQDALEKSSLMSKVHQTQDSIERKLSTLTSRQREVLDLVVEGHASKVIAQLLKRSKKTIDVHRAQIMRKLDASSVADLVRMVCTAGAAARTKTN